MESPQPSALALSDEDTLSESDSIFRTSLPRADPDDDVRSLARSVYRDVWSQYFSWEQDYCSRVIRETVQKYHPPPPLSSLRAAVDHHLSPDADVDMAVDFDVDADSVSIIDLSDASFQHEAIETLLDPYPNYEACTPTDVNIMLRDGDPEHSKFMPFIPYADDPTFDYMAYFRNAGFDGFQWQHDQSGLDKPDFEAVHVETLRRLHFQHKLSIARIDQLKMIPRVRYSEESDGLLWRSNQCDFPHWPGSVLSELDSLSSITYYIPLAKDTGARLRSVTALFCSNLSCIQSFCPTHVEPYPYPHHVKAHLNSVDLLSQNEKPCGDLCFSHFQDISNIIPDEWDPSDIADLHNFLNYMPDASPCDLAVILYKPCFEVFYHRTSEIPDESILEFDDEINNKQESIRFKDVGNTYSEFSRIGHHPCDHTGPCNARANCLCYQNKIHCLRNCLCSIKCSLRWKGCSCKKKGKTCPSTTCECKLAHKECDLELCKCTRKSCQNIQLQNDMLELLVIKAAEFGLGAFASKAIKKGAFIGEYTGRLFSDTSSHHDELIQNHIKLNYTFTLNHEAIIDGLRMGNETRYLNDGDESKVNASAEVKVVNGDHRIILTADRDIRKDEELLLAYGEAYWASHAGMKS